MTSEKKEELKNSNTKLKTIRLISPYSIYQNGIRIMINQVLLPDLTTIIENYARVCLWKEDINSIKLIIYYNYEIYSGKSKYISYRNTDQLTSNSEDYITQYSSFDHPDSNGRFIRFISYVRDYIVYEYDKAMKSW